MVLLLYMLKMDDVFSYSLEVVITTPHDILSQYFTHNKILL